ncbi:MAG: hypothetical protein JWO69_1725, partial [Thermoleophilia bacterium]|nr:hypothetical protein [Thermoleophilia bacterium]
FGVNVVASAGGAAGAGGADFTTYGFDKRLDATSPLLLDAMAGGTSARTKVEVRAANTAARHLTFDFTDSRVVDVQQVASGTSVAESVELGWSRVTIDYFGGAAASAGRFSFNQATGIGS